MTHVPPRASNPRRPSTNARRQPTNPRRQPTDLQRQPTWSERLADPGWSIVPLRAFLGVTFVYAGLQKIANPDFFSSTSPISIAGQIRSLQHTSPIGGLLAIAAHTPALAGLAIALGELAVGLGTLLGLYTRVAAAGGALLALTFFLTVSWTTTPYYYGADIVFVFAWLTMVGIGDRGVLSLQAWISRQARRRVMRNPGRAAIGPARMQAEGDRRAALETRRAAVIAAGGAVVLAGLTAGVGRLAGGTSSSTPLALAGPTTQHKSPAAAPPERTTTAPAAGTAPARLRGTAIGHTADVPAGQARPFMDPATGDPAWLVQPSAGHFVAFDAVCTHAGCTVDYNPATMHFDCPCHGGMFDARTGQVLQGPPASPLRPIPVVAVNGQLRVDA